SCHHSALSCSSGLVMAPIRGGVADPGSCTESRTLGQGDFATGRPVGPEKLFRRRLRQLIARKYRSIDRFYLETDFSKGHLSEILRGKGSPSVSTLIKLARALGVEVKDFFVFPERAQIGRASCRERM